MEIMVSLAILGMSVFILLQSHFGALAVYETITGEINRRGLIERAMGEAEVGVFMGELTGDGDFGAQYGEEYTWTYEATHVGEDMLVQLYEVNVTVRMPDGSDTLMSFLLYNPSAEVLGDGGA
jgi:hypothetical protein